eukprot:1306553-Rhodomonas_salina.2
MHPGKDSWTLGRDTPKLIFYFSGYLILEEQAVTLQLAFTLTTTGQLSGRIMYPVSAREGRNELDLPASMRTKALDSVLPDQAEFKEEARSCFGAPGPS